MCGIGGILRVWTPDQRELALRTPHAQSIPEAWLDILDDAVKHRGPDGQGRFRDRAIRPDGCVVDVAFIHRRLSIIDHAGGHQPMVWTRTTGILPVADVERYTARIASNHGQDARGTDSDDRIAVVFNGCIYNHRELRAELQNAGHVFNTDHSDTEVLVHGWREWQSELWRRLDGMFAVALWDASSGSLVVARDAFGEKPLYYEGGRARADGNVVVAFASTASAILRARAHRWGDASVRASRLRGWVRYGFDQSPPVASSHQTLACSWVGLTGELDPQPHHFKFLPNQGSRERTRHVDAETVDDLVRKAVAQRLEADVPLGCLLSGGVDSSLIAALAMQLRGSLRTFTVRMPVGGFDESEFAGAIARHLGTNHVVLDCEPRPADDLQSLITSIGLPFGDSSLLPSAWVSRAARQQVRVALGGDGGDELFVGYDRYAAVGWLRPSIKPLAQGLRLLLPRPRQPRGNLARAFRLVEAASGDGYLDLVSIFPSRVLRELVGPTTNTLPSVHINDMASAISWDVGHYLCDDLMRKSDSASMHSALEVRSPFLDRSITDATKHAPFSDLCPRGQRKGLLRQVARKYLPPEIVDRPKMGFAIPIGEWFRSDYGGLRTMLLDHLNSAEPFGPPSLGINLNMPFIRQMLDEHLGTGPSGLVKRDHSQRLYMLLVLSIWSKWLGSLR